jgi:integral membrane sensor domain MASE1
LVQATFALGTIYLFAPPLAANSFSYFRQSEIAPLHWFGVIFYALSIALHLTRRQRRHFPARMVAGLASVLLYVFAWTFWPTGLTAVAIYSVIAWGAAGEAFFVSDEC